MLVGVSSGAALSFLLNLKREEELFSHEDLGGENDMLDKANHYLLLARNKVEEMVREAEEKSSSILEEAGKTLLYLKEKTADMHNKISEGKDAEAEELKDELNKIIAEFKKKL